MKSQQIANAIIFVVLLGLNTINCLIRGKYFLAGINLFVLVLWVFIYKTRCDWKESKMSQSHFRIERWILISFALINSIFVTSFISIFYTIVLGYLIFETVNLYKNKESQLPKVVEQLLNWFKK